MPRNLDPATIESFGDEWSRFDQTALGADEASAIFQDYFSIFPWSELPENATGFDMGCGSGRWARFVSPRVGHLHCIDPSSAIEVARSALADLPNLSFHRASVSDAPLPANSQDFGYSLGVLHHIPDTAEGLNACTRLLKPGAPFLVYLYYAFDNRSRAFRLVWRLTDWLRRFVCRLPPRSKHLVTDLVAVLVYYPLARLALIAEHLGLAVSGIPLAYYRRLSVYTMRTDARDRLGTPLEHRFTRDQIRQMLESAGLKDIRFSDGPPYWCAVGVKR